MVNISISGDELLRRTQMKLGQAEIEKQILDETLARLAALSTPEQLQQAGLVAPQPPTLEDAAEIPEHDSGLVLGGPDDNVSELLKPRGKNGQGKPEAVPV